MMQKITKGLLEHEETGDTETAEEGVRLWTNWALMHAHGERLDLALEISKAVMNYLAYDQEDTRP